MHVYRSLAEVPPDFGPSALSIGNFDGVHFGHRRILRRVRQLASAHGWKASVLTFDPHPTRVVAPDRTPPLLTSPQRRAALMQEEGIEQVLILPFTKELALLSPEEFVERLLVKALAARAVLVGDNFHFGHKQAGNVAVLADLGRKFGFQTEIVAAVSCHGRVVSSSGIRQLIRAGNVSLASRLLQHAYGLEGDVVSGRGVGSKQTVPTLNLSTQAEVIPASGVYITRTRDLEDQREWHSITNIGYRPTFGTSDQLTIETFLLDFQPASSPSLSQPTPQPNRDREGAATSPNSPSPTGAPPAQSHPPRRIRVEFLRRVREERKFESPEALRAQILKDVRTAQAFFRRVNAWTGPPCTSC